MDAHPGRPLEPVQLDNLRAGRPAGPMLDKEVPPHPVPILREPLRPPVHVVERRKTTEVHRNVRQGTMFKLLFNARG